MINRTVFANSLNDLGKNGNLSANECERFGITWGCKPDCPVFANGDCKDCYYENIDMFIAHNEIDKTEANELIELYDSKLSAEQKCKLHIVLNSMQLV